jgi:hypothetical protein
MGFLPTNSAFERKAHDTFQNDHERLKLLGIDVACSDAEFLLREMLRGICHVIS